MMRSVVSETGLYIKVFISGNVLPLMRKPPSAVHHSSHNFQKTNPHSFTFVERWPILNLKKNPVEDVNHLPWMERDRLDQDEIWPCAAKAFRV